MSYFKEYNMRKILSILISLVATSYGAGAQDTPNAVPINPQTQTQTQAQTSANDRELLFAEAETSRAAGNASRVRDGVQRKEPRGAPTEDDALALAAIESLMSMPSERALPVIKKVLAGSQSQLVKERALFVLSQLDLPEANTLMLEYAKTPNSPLRFQAIRNIGIGGNAKAIAALRDVYASGDAKIKKEVLQAWMIAGSKAEVYQAAVNAKSESEANDAIQMLGIMGAKDELRKLGDLKKSNSSLVEAYSISGDLDSLKKLASGPGEMSVRLNAIRGLGIIGKDNAKTALREIYTANNDSRLKDAALQGMLIANDEPGVLRLYREAKSSEEKRNLLKTLSLMGGDAAMQAIDSALEGKK
jgi:HEAT repeat protein